MRKTKDLNKVLPAIISVIVICTFPIFSWSQNPEWQMYDTGNSGLPYNGIPAIGIDEQGNIWAGTGKWMTEAGGGLAKFDGQNWTVYNTSNSGLPHNDHTGLKIDGKGNIWSSTEGGLSRFDGTNWIAYTTQNSGLPTNKITAPSFDSKGNMWIGTFPDSGLVKYDGTNWTIYNTSNSELPNNFVTRLAVDSQDNVWIATYGGGLAKFDGTNWTVYNTSNSGLPSNNTSTLAFDKQGSIWICTYGSGLVKFNGQQWITYNTTNSGIPHNWLWSVTIDQQGNVWAGTQGGLAMFDGESWTVFNTSNSALMDNEIYSIAIDPNWNVWIGTAAGGLTVYRLGEKTPIVDFNGNGTFDIKDLVKVIEHWDTNEPVYDISPVPWGDGFVDENDLRVYMNYWEHEVNDSTLMAHWALDEPNGIIVADSTEEYFGIAHGEPLWRPDGGKVKGALELDGIDDYVSTPFILNPSKIPVFSVFAWIKGGLPGQVILSQIGSTNLLSVDASEGCLMTDKGAGRGSSELISEVIITDGDWHRIGFTWDGENRILYVDDFIAAIDTQPGLPSSEAGFYIGAEKGLKSDCFWTGLIDDVRIYNRVITP